MKLTRPVVGLIAAAAVGGFALPSQAATKAATLYFDNQGSSGASGCTPSYVLSKLTPSGTPCEGPTVAAEGTGLVATDVYNSQSSGVGWKLDATKPVTGVVNIGNYPIISTGASPNQTFGGPSGAEVTIKVNGVTVGTASGTGVAAPGGTVAVPIKMKLPAKLNGKVIKTVEADVKMSTGVVLTGVSFNSKSPSKLVFATKA